jgi:hypothetical protein
LSRGLLRARDLTESENLPLSQACLAQMLGVQRNVVSLVANSLQRPALSATAVGTSKSRKQRD